MFKTMSGLFALVLLAGCRPSVGMSQTAGRDHGMHTGRRALALSGDQHIFFMRHADKSSSYPDCPGSAVPPEDVECYSEAIMGDNPPITACGTRQAQLAADILLDLTEELGGIQQLGVSPFSRTLMTALPLARRLNMKLKVDSAFSEATEEDGPFRANNVLLRPDVLAQLSEVQGTFWDRNYGAPPIPTPETVGLYNQRVAEGVETIRDRFPPASGNLVVVTHAMPAFSLAYGLCRELFEPSGGDPNCTGLANFLYGQHAIAPAGLVHVVLGADGRCKSLGQTQNDAYRAAGCGNTVPYKGDFCENPTYYWSCPLGEALLC